MWNVDDWGTMIWGGPSLLPLFGPLGLALLLVCFVAGAWFRLRPKTVLGLTGGVVLAVPLLAFAVTPPHTFVNGTVADADEVNANFSALDAAVGALSYRVVFVTAGSYPADFGGFAFADAACQADADAVGLPGVFKAWLSDNTTNAVDRLTHGQGPYVLPGMSALAFRFDLLLDGSLDEEFNRHADGSLVASGSAWTGTLADGTTSGVTCNNWTLPSVSGTVGSRNFKDAFWTDGGPANCTQTSARFYCLQQ